MKGADDQGDCRADRARMTATKRLDPSFDDVSDTKGIARKGRRRKKKKAARGWHSLISGSYYLRRNTIFYRKAPLMCTV